MAMEVTGPRDAKCVLSALVISCSSNVPAFCKGTDHRRRIASSFAATGLGPPLRPSAAVWKRLPERLGNAVGTSYFLTDIRTPGSAAAGQEPRERWNVTLAAPTTDANADAEDLAVDADAAAAEEPKAGMKRARGE